MKIEIGDTFTILVELDEKSGPFPYNEFKIGNEFKVQRIYFNKRGNSKHDQIYFYNKNIGSQSHIVRHYFELNKKYIKVNNLKRKLDHLIKVS